MENFDPRVDAYIAKSAEFAKPILTHIRNLVHQAIPDVQETLKWSMPFFDYKGAVCQIAAFKQHCAFGFWKASAHPDPYKILQIGGEESSAGNFGRLTSITDLPADDVLIAYIIEAVRLNENGVKNPARANKPKAEKKEAVMPDDFAEMLDSNPAAQANFNNFSPGKQREYIDWITDAKAEATRLKRMQTALEWISEGKSRNWKYQSC